MAIEFAAAAPWLVEAQKFVGLKEIVGSRHEAKILQFFAEAGHPGIHDDETAWCAAFVGAMLRRAGYSSSGALNARSYLNFGTKLDNPTPGCIVVFKRGSSAWQGHVGFVQSVNADGSLNVLGGNQGNAVSVARFGTGDLLGYRWPLIKSAPAAKGQPKKPVDEKVKDTGKVIAGGGVAGTVATGVEQGWGAWDWFIAALVLAVIAGAAYGAYRWWRNRRVRQEAVAAIDDAAANLSADPDEPVAEVLAEATSRVQLASALLKGEQPQPRRRRTSEPRKAKKRPSAKRKKRSA